MERILEECKNEFRIDTKVITNLLQVEPTYKGDKDKTTGTNASMVRTKKKYYIAEDGTLSKEPFFSANGFRGIMRRNIARKIFSTLEQKEGIKFSVDTIHLYASGGGTTVNNFTSFLPPKLTYSQKEEFREKNPFISLFGAGLGDMDGKIAICDLVPQQKGLNLIDYLFAVRFDETERSSVLAPLIDQESVEEYQKTLEETRRGNKEIQKKQKELDKEIKLRKKMQSEGIDENDIAEQNEKIEGFQNDLKALLADKGMSYLQTYKAEYIIPNTKLTSSIATRAGYELTDIERGMMLYGLIATSQQNIGSYTRIGWGALDWKVRNDNDEILFTTTCDPKYVLSKETVITDTGNEVLKPFIEWVDSIDKEDIYLP